MDECTSNILPAVDSAEDDNYTNELLQKTRQEDLTRSLAAQRKAQADIDLWAGLLGQHADKTTNKTLKNIFAGLLEAIGKKRVRDREVESHSFSTSCEPAEKHFASVTVPPATGATVAGSGKKRGRPLKNQGENTPAEKQGLSMATSDQSLNERDVQTYHSSASLSATEAPKTPDTPSPSPSHDSYEKLLQDASADEMPGSGQRQGPPARRAAGVS